METNIIINDYKERLKYYINEVDNKQLIDAFDVICDTLNKGKKIFIIGNGGSLATASHMVEDLMLNNEYKSRVITLDSSPNISATANDIDYEDIFVAQLVNLFDDGDLLITISGSGNSPNILRAIQYANPLGNTISMSGFDGGKAKELAKYPIHVRTTHKDYETTEDVHSMICHILTYLVKESYEN